MHQLIYQNIKKARMSNMYSQEYVSVKLGISQRSYSSIENGKTPLTINRLFDILKILNTTISEILECEKSCPLYLDIKESTDNHKIYNEISPEILIEQKELFERLIKSKEEEIIFLKRLLLK